MTYGSEFPLNKDPRPHSDVEQAIDFGGIQDIFGVERTDHSAKIEKLKSDKEQLKKQLVGLEKRLANNEIEIASCTHPNADAQMQINLVLLQHRQDIHAKIAVIKEILGLTDHQLILLGVTTTNPNESSQSK